jgi:hypothetical protein
MAFGGARCQLVVRVLPVSLDLLSLHVPFAPMAFVSWFSTSAALGQQNVSHFEIAIVNQGLIPPQVGKKAKAQLEDEYQESGCRTSSQVICNSFAGLLASLLWGALFVPDFPVLLRGRFPRL